MTDSFRSYIGRVPKVAGIGDKVRKRDILLMEFLVAGVLPRVCTPLHLAGLSIS